MKKTYATSFHTLLANIAPSSRVAELLEKSARLPRYCNQDAPMDYFSYREKQGLVSYLPANRPLQWTDDGRAWRRDGRQEIKPGKFAAQILHPRLVKRIKPEMLAKFAENFRLEEERHNFSVREISFSEAYAMQGSTSCMADKPVAPFYSAFGPDILTALGVFQCGKLVARALLWKEIKNQEYKAPLVDRIYGSTPEATEFLIQYAEDQKYYRKYAQRLWCVDVVHPDSGTTSCESWYISTPSSACDAISECSFFPYIDTFPYQDDDGDFNVVKTDDDNFVYQNTNGTRSGGPDIHEGQVQTDDGDWIDEDEATYVEGYGYLPSDECVTCHRSEESIRLCDAYRIRIAQNETIYIHEDYVSHE